MSGILIQNKVAAMNVDAFNRPAVSASDIENGSVFNLLTKSSDAGSEEVWVATTPATGALTNLWMAYEPEVPSVYAGTKAYKGLSPDPRDFINKAGEVFTAFRLQLGDILTLSADALAGSKSTNTFVVAADGALKLTWAASAGAGVSLSLKDETYISLATGSLGDTQRIAAYQFEVVKLA